ncbi:MAG: glycosyltransferase family 4 protein [Thermoleophilia bacterium]|nr:glycosyltransferase family 4 protein [Thermoleophilia bacterium]MDH5333032.1 glycosyltransferase family 4 protein [Thermoleophilia bacterium]
MSETRPRLLVLNQYYWPGVEATAQLLSQLCEALAEDYEVTVVTGNLHGQEGLPAEEVRNGVRILRTRSTAFDRTRLHLRAANYVSYLAESVLAGLGGQRPDLVLCMTDPPIVGDVGLVVARRFDAPLVVISQDVFPEIAERLKRLQSKALLGTLRQLVGLYLRRADRIVAIGETMKLRLVEKGAPGERIEVIPNWVDTAELTPRLRNNAWAREHGLDRGFVVMHSGNVGHAQNLDSLVRAATFLRDLDALRIVIVGFGARHGELATLARRLEVTDTVHFLPYQPREVLADSLSAADLHYVGLARGLSGYVVPSRLYGILAVGRPVLVAADEESETARLVREADCGIVVPPGRPDVVATTLRSLVEGSLGLGGMGERGREYVEREADREVAFARYRRVFADVVASSAR